MDLLQVLGAAKAVKDSLVAGKPVEAWENTLPLQTFAIAVCRQSGLQASPSDVQTKADIKATLDECEALCKTAPTVAAGTEKIGDGKILELVIKLITILGPLFL